VTPRGTVEVPAQTHRGGPRWQRSLQTYERDAFELFDNPNVTVPCPYDGVLDGTPICPITVLHPAHRRVGKKSAVHLRSHGQGLALHGELDLMETEDILASLSDIAEATDRDMRLDLSELTFLDVAGARSLVLAATSFSSRGHQLQLVNARPIVRRCLDLFDFPEQDT
jgi:anti-anti-sigma factor